MKEKNFGTKKNIVNAINETFKKFNKIIVIEDDLILSKSFLYFMNFCLNNYKDKKNLAYKWLVLSFYEKIYK